MGVGVSSWTLAREVARSGQLGVVSGTALDTLLVRRLALGDPGGHMRRALEAFPVPRIAQRVLARYFKPNGSTRTPEAQPQPLATGQSDLDSAGPSEHRADATTSPRSRFRLLPLPRATLTPEREWLLVLANFAEVYLAKEGHPGMVGINYLHKIQFPLLPSLYGAMLAGVDAVLIGAGIPADIPAVLDRFSRGESASITLDVLGAGPERHAQTFSPVALWTPVSRDPTPSPRRPRFLAIISSVTLAKALLKKSPGGVDGFVVEAPIAGGHNAPPRGPQQLSVRGEPVYGPRDDVNLAELATLGVPFWLAGGYASREKFRSALAAGAHGVQLGTVFAFCDESGLEPDLRRRFLADVLRDEGRVHTDPSASPTSFPFKVATLAGTLSDDAIYAQRPRLCDLGYLRRAYRKDDGTLDYRCPGEPVAEYVRKGGRVDDTVGRKCLCNALIANLGLGQQRSDGYEELPLLTAGDDLACIKPFISSERLRYHARDVIESILEPA
ncbi:MAG: nitronate monooxygenase [Planctomycetes bacterium]|nr:nitronate monooxygenase [Planctomycetota bacterium]